MVCLAAASCKLETLSTTDPTAFLRRDINKGFAEVTGDKVNRGAGYGLEVPCTYRL